MKVQKRFIKFLMFLSCAVLWSVVPVKNRKPMGFGSKNIIGGILAFTGIKLLERIKQ